MKTIEEMRKELEGLKAKAALPALSDEDEMRAQVRAELAKAKKTIQASEAKARAAREDDIFEELEAKHAGVDLERIDSDGGMVVMRPPSIAKGRHFQQIALKGKLSPDAIEDFVKPCVVYPPPQELEERLEKYPLLAPTLCSIAQEIGSAAAERRGKK